MAGTDNGDKPSGSSGSRRGDAAKVGASASRASAKAAAKAGKTGPGPSGSKRGRGKPAPVKKPFPVGFAAGVAVLVLLLGGILVYAATNVGSGFQTALDKADKKFTGLRVEANLSANHIDPTKGTRVDYPDETTRPPDGGNHNPIWYKCAAYAAPIVQENAVHSLEHGAVWITYRPDLPADQIKVLTSDIAVNSEYGLLSPYLGQTAPIMATAWGRQIVAQSASDPQIAKFLEVYSGGPQQRENAGCASTGEATQPGIIPFSKDSSGAVVAGPDNGPHVTWKGDLPKTDAATPTPSTSITPTPAVTGLGGASGTATPSAGGSASTSPKAGATPTP